MRFFTGTRGSSMLTVIIIAMLIAVIAAVTFKAVNFSSKKTGQRRSAASALNIAEAGKEDAIAQIKMRTKNPTAGQKVTLIAATQFGGGSYTVACSANAAISRMWLWSTGTLKGKSATVKVVADLAIPGVSITGIRGAITSNGNVATTGNIFIDGRDYDTSGASPQNGLYGVSTCGTHTDAGSAQIGGGSTAPPTPKGIAAGSIESTADCGAFPESPEEVLGMEDGALEPQKQAGCPPSGYVGIWYTETDCDVTGSGIYILHNSTTTASLTNFHGDWKGLMIVDRVSQINGNGTLTGALIVLSEGYSNIFGNGNSKIKYSSAIINKLTEYCTNNLARTVTVLSWQEM